MIPPTSIDGTDISGATIDGTDVQEITVDGDVVFSSQPLPADLIHQYSAFSLNLSNGATVDPWQDDSGNQNLQAVGAPTYVTNGINGNPSVRYDDNDDLHKVNTKAPFNFLHDGTTAYSCYIVVETFGSGGLYTPLSTQGVFGSGQRGASINRDDRGGNNNLRFRVSNGSDSIVEIESSGGFPANSPRIFSIHFDGLDTYRLFDGKSLVGSDTTTNQSTSDSNTTFQRGETENSFGVTEPLDGDVGADRYYNTEHSSTRRDNEIDDLANQFSISV